MNLTTVQECTHLNAEDLPKLLNNYLSTLMLTIRNGEYLLKPRTRQKTLFMTISTRIYERTSSISI